MPEDVNPRFFITRVLVSMLENDAELPTMLFTPKSDMNVFENVATEKDAKSPFSVFTNVFENVAVVPTMLENDT